MKTIKNRRLMAMALLATLVVIPSLLQAQDTGDKKDNFKLSYTRSFEPFTVANGDKAEGLAIDVLTAAFAKANLKVIFVGVGQDEEQNSLTTGKVDGLVFFGVTPDRKKTFDFSDPYLITGGALFTKAPNPTSSDLKDFEGKTVATPQKGPLAAYIKNKYPKITLVTDVKDYPETLEAVLNGKAYAAALNTQVGAVLAQKLFPGKFSLPTKGYLEIPIGVAVTKGKQDFLLTKFNAGLKTILSDGTYDGIIAKWGVAQATKPM